jgi:ribosome-associated protein
MNFEIIRKELTLKGVKSSGPGGQNVNKVATKIELSFDLENSSALSEHEKNSLKTSIKGRLTKDNILVLQCDESRSQFKNKSIVINRLKKIFHEGLKRPKSRKRSHPTRSSVLKRLDTKKFQSKKKANRRKPDY